MLDPPEDPDAPHPLRAFSVAAALCAAPFSFAIPAEAGFDDGQGRDWQTLTATTQVSWNQLAQVCPLDGQTACVGSAGPRDVSGWVWATSGQVVELFALYDPSVLPTGNSSSGYGGFAAEAFLADFGATFSFASTYQAGASASGWTASRDETGAPLEGSASWFTNLVSFPGGFGLGPAADASSATQHRGIFLWRPTGLDDGLVHASDDAGRVASPAGGVAVANVLVNDWVGGVPASFANVVLDPAQAGALRLDPASGAVHVASGAPPGVHTLTYRVCARLEPANCDTALVTVTVPSYVLNAVDDAGTASPTTGGVAIANVVANDTLGAATATLTRVSVSLVSTTHTGVTLHATTGSVRVAAGTPIGSQTLVYIACERANPANCDTASAVVQIARPSVYAGDDSARATSKRAGVAIASVFANDTIGGVRASSANATLTLVIAPTNRIQLNRTTGAVTVGSKSSSGLYRFSYRICERADPTNCDTATVTLDLSGRLR